MVLLGIASDKRTIYVRTDDLSMRENEQVRECADIISNFRKRNRNYFLYSVLASIACILLSLVGCLIARTFGVEVNNTTVGNLAIITFVVAVVAWVVVEGLGRLSNAYHMKNEVRTLAEHMKSAKRCNDFVLEYRADSKVVQDAFEKHSQLAKAIA